MGTQAFTVAVRTTGRVAVSGGRPSLLAGTAGIAPLALVRGTSKRAGNQLSELIRQGTMSALPPDMVLLLSQPGVATIMESLYNALAKGIKRLLDLPQDDAVELSYASEMTIIGDIFGVDVVHLRESEDS